MDEFTEKIHINYLKQEIYKMQKTAEDLSKMIENDKNGDNELKESLESLRRNTIEHLEIKKRELNAMYDMKLKLSHN